ncbi:hypothetical protein AVEN_35915-1 [Araneus ventricosus]|uniref:Uncharacterized protein n=1 Tax=Araneus ventricosus TaxID=182803 RepID=A0A4Y2LYT2_ARAVE|nr:hypothetical protein AVEN_35915-1 [Araneus ventricosus]
MECDRYGVSDRTATLFASVVLQDIGIVHEGEASHVIEEQGFLLTRASRQLLRSSDLPNRDEQTVLPSDEFHNPVT